MVMKNKSISLVNLALQGGGAHGAFTWGVLDRLLEEERLIIEGVSGTSAGAMNAVVMAQGLMTGGREGARESLKTFWEALSHKGISDVKLLGTTKLPGVDMSPAFSILLSLGWFLSPYQFNPLAFDPLRNIVGELIDFDRLRTESPIKLFIAATRVRTGKIRIFETHELSADALLASACLPSLHHAVEIDGEAYWDGAFAGNPAIYPLVYNCQSSDIVVVLLAPLEIAAHPTSAEAIRNRAAELSFNAAFLREMRAIADAKQRYGKSFITVGKLERLIRDIRIHLIQEEDLMNNLSHKSKLNTSEAFLNMLFEEGRESAEMWLDKNSHQIGKKSSVNLMEVFG